MIYLDFCFKTSIASNDLIRTLLEKANGLEAFFIVGCILGYTYTDPKLAKSEMAQFLQIQLFHC